MLSGLWLVPGSSWAKEAEKRRRAAQRAQARGIWLLWRLGTGVACTLQWRRMRTVDLAVPDDWTDEDVVRFVEDTALAAGLTISSRGTLRSYPGCVHWHLTRAGSTGTLEPTWWPAKRRLWLKVASNREAPWISEAVVLYESLLCGS